MRVPLAQAAQADRFQHGGDLAAAPVPGGEPEPDVRLDRQVREQAAFLRHVADAAPFRRHVDAGTVDQQVTDGDRAAA